MQRKAALVVRVDQFVRRGARFGQNPQPCEWIYAIVDSQDAGRDGRTAYAVEAVASRDEIAR